MSKTQVLTVYFNDGSRMAFSFPEQESNAMAKKIKLAEVLSNNQFVIEADGSLLVFPMTSIKYIQLSDANFAGIEDIQLPKFIIRNATILT